MRLVPLLVALPLWGAEDVNAILKRLIDSEAGNEKRAQQYTYVEETRRFNIDKGGRRHQVAWETEEVLFVEGVKYKKRVARNGRPLSSREQAQVESEMRKTAEERRRQQHPTAPGGTVFRQGAFTHQSADLGSLGELLTLFDNRLAGEEEVRGHRTWVIESTPKTSHFPANEHERQVYTFRKKFWADQQENVLVRAVYTVSVDSSFVGPGSTFTFDYEKVDTDTWQPVSLVIDFSMARELVFRPTGSTVYGMSKFQKFDVQSTITVADPGQ